jgi:hypothetical protein
MRTSDDRGRRITDPGAAVRAIGRPRPTPAFARCCGRPVGDEPARLGARMIRKTYGIDIVALTLAIIVPAAILMIGSALMREVADPIPPALPAAD